MSIFPHAKSKALCIAETHRVIGGKTSRWIEVTAGDDDGEVSATAERADMYDNVCIVARRGEEEERRGGDLSI